MERAFGLPVYSTGRQAAGVLESAGLQPYVAHLQQQLGVGFEHRCSLESMVAALRGWPWVPAQADCPVGQLEYRGV